MSLNHTAMVNSTIIGVESAVFHHIVVEVNETYGSVRSICGVGAGGIYYMSATDLAKLTNYYSTEMIIFWCKSNFLRYYELLVVRKQYVDVMKMSLGTRATRVLGKTSYEW